MSDNYPPGAANDKNAPWNRPAPKYKEWEPELIGECELCSKQGDINKDWVCENCFDTEQMLEDCV